MRGKIHGIWLTGDGKLHEAIIPNLSSRLQEANENNFSIDLWTNINELDPSELEKLKLNKIIIRDHSECKDSSLYEYFLFFFQKGLSGDKSAFALASDILRMAILELTPDDEYFIYADPNDVVFTELNDSLINLDSRMRGRNLLGFSFYVEPIFDNESFHIRNDVLIALKIQNPSFFKDYLDFYQRHIALMYKSYVTPLNDGQAQELARSISNQTGNAFFKILQFSSRSIVSATFGNYEDFSSSINCNDFFPYIRITEFGNTWLPTGECLEEKNELENLLKDQYSKEDVNFLLSSSPNYFCYLPRFEEVFLWNVFTNIHELGFDASLSALPAPEEKKLITYPSWDEAKNALSSPRGLLTSFSIYNRAEKRFIIEHRHESEELQVEYDKNYGLVLKK